MNFDSWTRIRPKFTIDLRYVVNRNFSEANGFVPGKNFNFEIIFNFNYHFASNQMKSLLEKWDIFRFLVSISENINLVGFLIRTQNILVDYEFLYLFGGTALLNDRQI